MSVAYTLGSPNSFMAFGVVPRSKLMDIAALPAVFRVFPDLKVNYNDTRLDSSGGLIQTDMFRVRGVLGVTQVNSTLHLQGDGVKVAIVDTGTDFSNPNMAASYARDSNRVPLALDPDGAGIVLTNTTLSRFTNSSGVFLNMLSKGHGTRVSIYLGAITYPTVVLPLMWDISNYRIGADATHFIVSQSGVYHFGLAFEITPAGFWLFPTLVVDSKVAGNYDTVYIDFNSAAAASVHFIAESLKFNTKADWSFADDTPHHLGDGTEVLSADLNGDGVSDISAGLLGARVLDVFGAVQKPGSKFDFDLGALSGNVLSPMDPGGNYVGVMYDNQGHGSQTAANVASSGSYPYDVYGNGTKYKLPGVAPNAKIIAIKALYIGDILYGWMWASGLDYNAGSGKWTYSGNHKADIISNSWGVSVWPLLVSGLDYDVASLLEDVLSLPKSLSPDYPGTIFTQAIGNGGPGYGTITTPASSAFGITVGASTSWHVASQFSSTGLSYYGGSSSYADDVVGWSDRGPGLTGVSKPDVVNIGAFAFVPEDIMSAGGDGRKAWSFFGGTSEATPLTAGVAALVVQALSLKGVTTTPSLVKDILMSTASDTGNDPFVQGAGRVNATAAVSLALDGSALMKSAFAVSNTASYANLASQLTGAASTLSKVIGQNFSLNSFPTEMESWFAGEITQGKTSNASFLVRNPTHTPFSASLSTYTYKLYGQASFSNVSTPGSNLYVNLTKAIGRIPAGTDLAVFREYFPFNSWYNSSSSPYYVDSVTRLRLQVYNWNDVDHDHKVQVPETALINTDYAWADAEEVRVSSPSAKFTGTPLIGVYQNPKLDSYWYGVTNKSATPIHFTISVYFYKRVPWSWVTLDRPSLGLGASSNASFRATIHVPANVSAGTYEGYVAVTGSNGQTARVPVSIAVPLTPTVKGVPYVFGGIKGGDGIMYDNGATYGAADFSWRYESGNWRAYKLAVEDPTVNQGTVKIDWSNPMTSINIFILNPEGKIIATSSPPGLYKSILRQFVETIPILPSPSNDYLGYSPLSSLGWGGGFAPSQNNGPTSSILQFPVNETGMYTVVVHNALYSGVAPFERYVGSVELNTVLPVQSAPGLQVTAPNTPTRGVVSVPLNITGQDISTVTYSVDLSPALPIGDNRTLSIDTKKLGDGVHYVTVTVGDLVGHVTSSSFKLTVLNTAPVLFVGNPVNGTTLNGIVHVTFLTTSNYVASLTASIDNAAFNAGAGGFTWNSTGVPDGSHVLRIQVTDQAGNTANSIVTFQTNNRALAQQLEQIGTLNTYLTITSGAVVVAVVVAALAFLRRKRTY
jgi:subtilisin family serine protease